MFQLLKGEAITPANLEQMNWGDVQNELARLSDHHKSITQDKDNTNDVKKWAAQRMKNFDNAAQLAAQLEANHHIFSRDAKNADDTQSVLLTVVNSCLLVPSSSRGNVIHRARSTSCNCEAGLSGKFCRHSALVLAIESIIMEDVAQRNQTPPDSNDIPF